MIKLTSSPNKVALVAKRAEKAMTMNFPTSMLEPFRVFRVQEVSLHSNFTNVDGPSVHFLCFSHTEHTVAYT